VTLINTDGMAFIGPGSEWFWTALSGIVLAVTFFAIYRQLRLEASSRAFELLDAYRREGESEAVLRAQLEILPAIRDGAEPTEIPTRAAILLGGIWERYALLAHTGHIDVKLLWEFDGRGPQIWWHMLAPWVRLRRESRGQAYLEHFEWLAGRMADLDRGAGEPAVGFETIARRLDEWIAASTEELSAARARRTIILGSSTDPRGEASVVAAAVAAAVAGES
jgi:hypothetical protein